MRMIASARMGAPQTEHRAGGHDLELRCAEASDDTRDGATRDARPATPWSFLDISQPLIRSSQLGWSYSPAAHTAPSPKPSHFKGNALRPALDGHHVERDARMSLATALKGPVAAARRARQETRARLSPDGDDIFNHRHVEHLDALGW
jgi:hypothetical protein